jgi:hypothetical protein
LANWSGDIPNGTIWSNSEIQHVVGTVRVPTGAMLTIQPGTIVKTNIFDGLSIEVRGTLHAVGTATSPIVFTSHRDDTGLRSETGATITAINNTVDGNFRGVAADGSSSKIILTNNHITGHLGAGVFASNAATINASFNDVFNPNRPNYEGLADQTGNNGNVSVNPK